MAGLESIFGKKFPTPILKPMAPFFVAGVIVLYGVNGFTNLLANSDEFKNDPRNANAGKAAH